TITDFPFSSNVEFNKDIVNWTDYLTSKKVGTGENIWVVVRAGGDERETIWPFGTKTDERDRVYIKFKIPKKDLFEIWSNQLEKQNLFQNYIQVLEVRMMKFIEMVMVIQQVITRQPILLHLLI
ncbi:MAG: hypothetical protein H8D94_01085, partial [Candidatus Pelagibacter sp.]|nr:hypothetical protein [Candidatus Pelagibacter sp.]